MPTVFGSASVEKVALEVRQELQVARVGELGACLADGNWEPFGHSIIGVARGGEVSKAV